MTYQLSCGHWVTDAPGYGIGAVMACAKCDTLRTTVIGFSDRFPAWGVQ